MKDAYWVLTALLGVFYLYAGGTKLTRSQEQLRPMMGWVDTTPMSVVRMIGALEVLGVLGLVLPPLTGVLPWVAIVTAACFVVLQVLAARVHLRRRELSLSSLNFALIVLAAVEIWLATVW